MASLIVILAYLAVLAMVLFPPKNLRSEEEEESAPWWRNVRFWASVVVVAQIAVYAIWG